MEQDGYAQETRPEKMTDLLPRLVERLRGPPSGFTHGHARLAAFWREIQAKLSNPGPVESGADLLEALDAWLERDGPPFAVVLAPTRVGRTLLLARWALSVVERGTAQVAFLPVDRRLGTTLERDALRLLYGMLPETGDVMCADLLTPHTWQNAVRLELEIGPDVEDPPLLVIVDGFDRAEAWSLPTKRSHRADPGERVRTLVSTDTPVDGGNSAAIEAICARNGWSRSAVEVFIVPPMPEDNVLAYVQESIREVRVQLDASGARGSDILHGCLALLAVAFRPMDLRDLSVFLGRLASSVQDELNAGWRVLGRLLEREDEGRGYRFRHDAIRQAWQVAEPAAVATWERRIVEVGREALWGVREEGLSPEEITPYLVDDFAAHLTRCDAPLDDFMALVSPAWLRIWKTRPDAMVGFIADVGRAKERAQDELHSKLADTEEARSARALLVTAILRCIIVEGSIVSVARANELPEETASGTPRERVIDWGHTTGAGPFRAQALVALAQELESPSRDCLLERAYEVTRREPACRGDGGLLVELATGLSGPRRVELAREAVSTFRARDEAAPDIVNALGLIRAAALLTEDEGLLLVAEAIKRAQPLLSHTLGGSSSLADAATGLSDPLLLLELSRASSCLDVEDRMSLLGRLSGLLSPEHRFGVLTEAARLYCDYFEHLEPTKWILPRYVLELAELGALLPEPRLRTLLPPAIAQMDRQMEHRHDECVLLQLTRHLPHDEKEVLLTEVRERLRLPLDWFHVFENCPAEVCELLGPAGAVELLERVRAFDTDYLGIPSAARLAPMLPPGMREVVVARLATEHAEEGDDAYTLPWVLRCARYMTTGDRVRLFCETSTRSGAMALSNVLNAPEGWLVKRTELIRLLGGEAAVLGAAREILETAGWLP